jgi:hypothetical protein
MNSKRPLTLQQAAGIAGVSPDTIARWCKWYGIGKQLHRKAPWRVDPVGLAIVVAGDGSALAAYQIEEDMSRQVWGNAQG